MPRSYGVRDATKNRKMFRRRELFTGLHFFPGHRSAVSQIEWKNIRAARNLFRVGLSRTKYFVVVVNRTRGFYARRYTKYKITVLERWISLFLLLESPRPESVFRVEAVVKIRLLDGQQEGVVSMGRFRCRLCLPFLKVVRMHFCIN